MSQAQLQALDNARAAFREYLRRWGLPTSKNLLNLIEKAVHQGWNSNFFIDRLRHTPEYVQQFPGIQWRAGMSEATYMSQFNAYKNIAQQAGVNFNRVDFAKAIKRGVSPDEFSDRAAAITSIQRWAPMFGYYADAAAARGMPVTKKGLADMLMKLGPKKYEKLYDELFLTAGLERVAGIQVGKEGVPGQDTPYAIARGDILDIVKQVEALSMGSFDPAKLDFAKIGIELRKYKPEYLQRYGVTTKDILELELGGPRAASIAEKAQRILSTQEATTAPRATPQSSTQVGQRSQQRQQELPQTY
jgi:hypothetical protein